MNDADIAFELHSEIIRNEQKRRILLLENMKHIHELHRTGLYKSVLGDENAPWSAYLSQHEVFYTRNKVYMLDKIYDLFVRQFAIDAERIAKIPQSKLSALLPIITKENADEWLTKAETLTSQDFNDEIRISQGKISYLNCPHSDTRELVECSTCGFKHRK